VSRFVYFSVILITCRAFSWCAEIPVAQAAGGKDMAAQEEQLRKEVSDKGWIIFSANPKEIETAQPAGGSGAGQELELYRMRPDGTKIRRITKTTGVKNIYPRISPDGKKILFQQIPSSKKNTHDLKGEMGEFCICNLDGTGFTVYGKKDEFPWASFSPDMKQLGCLFRKEGKIKIFDYKTKKVVKEMAAGGIARQLRWSLDGKYFCGTGNHKGLPWWEIIGINIATGETLLFTREGGSCTPDWFRSDLIMIVYSNRNPKIGEKGTGDKEYGTTTLMRADASGKKKKLIFADITTHVYGGCLSPDDKYVIFWGSGGEGGTQIAGEYDRQLRIVRMEDTPVVLPGFDELQKLYPGAKEGPVLHPKREDGKTILVGDLNSAWSYAEVPEEKIK